MNADTNVDLLVGNSNSDDVTVLLGDGAGGFTSAGSFAAGNRVEAVAVADMDADDTLDLVTANREGDSISVLLGVGDGTFGTAATFATDGAPSGLAVGDFNSDDRNDVATANQEDDNVSILLANAATPDDLDNLLPECGGRLRTDGRPAADVHAAGAGWG